MGEAANRDAHADQLFDPLNGAKVRRNRMPNSTKPPEQGAASADEERFSITLDRATYRQVEFLAELWNAIDVARKVKRYRKWVVSNVSPSLIRASVAGVLEEMGGYPQTQEEQKRLIARAVEGVLREEQKK